MRLPESTLFTFYWPSMKRRNRTGKYSGISQIFSPKHARRRGKITSEHQIEKAFLHVVLVMARSIARIALRSAGERKRPLGAGAPRQASAMAQYSANSGRLRGCKRLLIASCAISTL